MIVWEVDTGYKSGADRLIEIRILHVLPSVSMETLGEQSGCKRNLKFATMELKILMEDANRK